MNTVEDKRTQCKNIRLPVQGFSGLGIPLGLRITRTAYSRVLSDPMMSHDKTPIAFSAVGYSGGAAVYVVSGAALPRAGAGAVYELEQIS